MRTGILSDEGVRRMCPENAPIPMNRPDLLPQMTRVPGLRSTRPATAKAMLDSVERITGSNINALFIENSQKRPPVVQHVRYSNITFASTLQPARPTASTSRAVGTQTDDNGNSSETQTDNNGNSSETNGDESNGTQLHTDVESPSTTASNPDDPNEELDSEGYGTGDEAAEVAGHLETPPALQGNPAFVEEPDLPDTPVATPLRTSETFYRRRDQRSS